MQTLIIYPTSRAIRAASENLKQKNALLPTLMRMDEFERRVALVPKYTMVDPLQRALFLHQAARFEEFDRLNIDHELTRFYTKSDAIFKFFEELALEGIGIDDLEAADSYEEFERHLAILKMLLDGYQAKLNERGLTDKAFLPSIYQLNSGFLDNFDSIEISVEGYLSRHELRLMEKIAEKKELIVHFVTSSFNIKMQERFGEYGITLPMDAAVRFDFGKKEILEAKENQAVINAKVYQVEERYEQIGAALAEIEKMVRSGIDPDSIVLILPDESIKESLFLYDTMHNLNFAMGFDYSNTPHFKSLKALLEYWRNYDNESRYLLDHYSLDFEAILALDAKQKCSCKNFFDQLSAAGLHHLEDESIVSEQVAGRYEDFVKIFESEALGMSEWLFLWMQALESVAIDDVRGGKVTVMGVLETRGIAFDGVVIIDCNEGIVPTPSSKDQFLNSLVRSKAGLPTLNDRESLQKQYYKRLLEGAKEAVILCCSSENRLPSKFLYELGLPEPNKIRSDLSLLYGEKSQIVEGTDVVVEDFAAEEIVWSASKFKTFLECKRKYYYRYIRKIASKKEDRLNEGEILHRLLQTLFSKEAHYATLEAMNQNFDKIFDEIYPQADPQMQYHRLLWREKLQSFFAAQIQHFESGWQVAACEAKVEGVISGLRFGGSIDRIDRLGEKRLLIDYKSGSIEEANKSKNLESLRDFQMNIYHELLSERHGSVDLAFIQILGGGKNVAFVGLEEKREFLLEHIEGVKNTKSFIASKCENLKLCEYCDYALMCERGKYL